MQPSEFVILVDSSDRQIGTAEKLSVHESGGQLHRAFSIFVLDDGDRLLLQRRAACKYHFPGLWSNTCCGHPRPGETVMEAAVRRLNEEFGITAPLRVVAELTYRASDPASGLTEHEYLHVLSGRADAIAAPHPNPAEIAAFRWLPIPDIKTELLSCPDRFTPWFPIALDALLDASRRQDL